MTVTFLPRADWDNSGAPRAGYAVPTSQFRRLVVHHSVIVHQPAPTLGDEIGYMRSLRTARPDLSLDVPYSFVVFRGEGPHDAVVAEGRGPGRTGAHTPGYNSTAYGVAYAGNADHDDISPGVLEAVRWVGRSYLAANALATIGHRDVLATACPGARLYPHLPDLQPPFASQAPPPPAPEDDDAMMKQYRLPDGSIYAVHGLKRKHIPTLALRDLLVARGLLDSQVIECGNTWDLDFLQLV